jgi:uncharacterized protein (TIGR02757 family)
MLKKKEAELRLLLENKFQEYNRPGFIKDDPILIPHQFTEKQDIEIAGLFAAVLAWGNRTTIINKCQELMSLMDYNPYEFILRHKDSDLIHLQEFKHRTFNDTDLLYFVAFLKHFYRRHESLEEAFTLQLKPEDTNTYNALAGFRNLFFSLEHPTRTRKHISSPETGSACKRLNMFLRWMVRKDQKGVDFGIWKEIRTDQLVCPCDVHVDRVARQLGLIKRSQTDWQTAVELTEELKRFDPVDPVKYDFALFGIGIDQRAKTKGIGLKKPPVSKRK